MEDSEATTVDEIARKVIRATLHLVVQERDDRVENADEEYQRTICQGKRKASGNDKYPAQLSGLNGDATRR